MSLEDWCEQVYFASQKAHIPQVVILSKKRAENAICAAATTSQTAIQHTAPCTIYISHKSILKKQRRMKKDQPLPCWSVEHCATVHNLGVEPAAGNKATIYTSNSVVHAAF